MTKSSKKLRQELKHKKKMLDFEKRIETIEGRLSLLLGCLKNHGINISVLEPENEPENGPSLTKQPETASTSTHNDKQNLNAENNLQIIEEDVKMHIFVHKLENLQEVENCGGEEPPEDNFVMATYDGPVSNDIVIESVKLEDSLASVQDPCGVYQCLDKDEGRVFRNNEVVSNGIDDQVVIDQENVEVDGENLEESEEYSDIDNSTVESVEEISILYEQVHNGQDQESKVPKKKKKVDQPKDSNLTSAKAKQPKAKVIKKKLKKCKKCSKTFVLVKKFKIHREICTATIKCCFIACDKVFKNEEYLRKHQRRQHGISIIDSVKCKFCNQYFLYKKNMKTHIVEVHQKNHDFPCYLCKKLTFKDKATALAHIKKTHQKKIEKSTDPLLKNKRKKPKIKKIRYKCLKCFACFFDKFAFMNHLKRMKCKRICARDCILCKRRFRTKKGLVVHTSTMHKDAKKKKIKKIKKTKTDTGSSSSGKKTS